jgi:hypothetical protein
MNPLFHSAWVTSSEFGLNHHQNQNKNQNNGEGTDGNGGKTVWPCVSGVWMNSHGLVVGNVPGTDWRKDLTPFHERLNRQRRQTVLMFPTLNRLPLVSERTG